MSLKENYGTQLGELTSGAWHVARFSIYITLVYIGFFFFAAEYQARLAHSGSGSGDDDDDDDDDDDVKGEGSGNSFHLIDGVKHKEDFIPFEEFENNGNSGVEVKEEFIPFKQDNRHEELSGEEDKHNELDREHFIPFDEETNSEQSGEDAASYARRRL